MKLADLERALKAERNSGRLGVPVALRVHAVLPALDGDIFSRLGIFQPLLNLLGDVNQGELQAKRHRLAKEATILWTEASGKTAFLTLASAAKQKQSLHVHLLGNHGMTELHGGEAWSDRVTGEVPALWEKEIQESLAKGTSIPIDAS